MPIVDSALAPLRDPRIAAQIAGQLAGHVLSQSPAWLWSADGSRILWANAVGAAIFGAANSSDSGRRRFDAKEPVAAEIIRLGRSLPASGQARLERLRGFGAGFGRALTCACLRIILSDGQPAVLIAAAEPAGPTLPLQERVGRLFSDHGQTLAVFAPDGTLLYATAAAVTRLAGAATLSAIGAEAVATQALASGRAKGPTGYGEVDAERLGGDASSVLVLTFAAPSDVAAPQGALDESAPAPAAAETIVAAPPLSGPELPAPPAAAPEPRSSQPPAREEPSAERRYPLRFVWQMDADGRFVVGSDEFIELVGPRTTAAFGRLWSEVAAALNLDPDNQVARAVATRETWSGIIIAWPVDESSERLPVELSGLPVFDRDRNFRGYRGFGVCRDIARLNRLARARRERPIGFGPQGEAPQQQREDRGLPAAAPPEAEQARAPAEEAEPAVTAAAVPPGEAVATAPPATSAPAERAIPTVVPAAANVVPFRSGAAGEPKAPSLSPVERRAFRELAQELTARLRATPEVPGADGGVGAPAEEAEAPAEAAEAAEIAAAPALAAATIQARAPMAEAVTQRPSADTGRPSFADFEPVLLDRIPVGVLIYRHESLLYANRRLLQWSGHSSLDALAAAGGLGALFIEPAALAESGGAQKLSIATRGGERLPVEGRLFTVPWSGGSALALVLTSREADQRASTPALATAEKDIRQLKAMLDAAADGVFLLDRDGRIVAASGAAEALFGCAAGELNGRLLSELLVSEPGAPDFLNRFARGAIIRNALVVTARVRGEPVPLALTLTRVSADRSCALVRDAAPLQKTEEDLRAAKREAQKAAAEKADFLAKISHEIRTPLNSITGFAEVIMAERFGPIGNERYRDYVKDIHDAGTHIVSLLNDLLDLSKVETGQLELTFDNVSLNDLTRQCVGIMQPQASRARIIIRTSLTPGLPKVIADERSLRQIVLNLLSNSIRFTGPGGQVIVSTAFADSGEAVLRVRDTGVGMSEKDVEIALAPFRHTATSASWGSGGTGVGLPLTKALVEANRAHFSIKSAPNAGTLIEVAFPATRVVAQ